MVIGKENVLLRQKMGLENKFFSTFDRKLDAGHKNAQLFNVMFFHNLLFCCYESASEKQMT